MHESISNGQEQQRARQPYRSQQEGHQLEAAWLDTLQVTTDSSKQQHTQGC
jgi:hypothetical protein